MSIRGEGKGGKKEGGGGYEHLIGSKCLQNTGKYS